MKTPLPDDRQQDDLDAQALDWFVRRDELDAAETAAFRAWLAADPAHRAAYARWQEDWDALDALPAAGIEALRRAAGAPADIDAVGRGTRRPAKTDRPCAPPVAWWPGLRTVAPRFAFAATVVATAVGGLLAWQHWQEPLYSAQYASARGEQREVALPDGSTLRLDTQTRVEVAIYRHRREVRLPEGQAVFEVAPDAGKPFHVFAGPVRITVVGTRFSVRNTPAIEGDAAVRVAVEEGRVRVRGDRPLSAELVEALTGTTAGVELGAGQQLAADPSGRPGPVGAVPPGGMAPWRDSRVSFNDTPLSQALAEFARYGDTRLAVRDPAVAALRITGTFDPRRVDGFARVLPRVLPVRLRERDGTIEIVSRR